MVARLGDVLYWFFTGMAVLTVVALVIITIIDLTSGKGGYGLEEIAITASIGAFSVILYMIGRACRYVLAGRF